MWFLHFKMGQVQPLLINTFNGIVSMVYSPLFQVYILGRNLERPFQIITVPKSPQTNATDTDDDDDEAVATKSDDNDERSDDPEAASEEEDDDDDDDDVWRWIDS